MKRLTRLTLLGGIAILATQLAGCILVPVPRHHHHSVAPVITAPVVTAPVVTPGRIALMPHHAAHLQRRFGSD